MTIPTPTRLEPDNHLFTTRWQWAMQKAKKHHSATLLMGGAGLRMAYACPIRTARLARARQLRRDGTCSNDSENETGASQGRA